ncbi:MAG TPA: DUF5011 domain-containing protein [Phycisphaerae bacterium]|nr:DUF5011 domain-containing protein [Phycisphaerae bacterium]
MLRRHLVPCLVVLGALTAGPALGQAPCIDTYFDDFNDGVLDANTIRWEPCATVSETNGRLEIFTPANCQYAGYRPNPANRRLCGDFDARIDFTLVNYPQPTSGARWAAFRVHTLSDTHVATMERTVSAASSTCTLNSTSYYKSFTTSSDNCNSTVRPTTHQSGKMRITRRGNIIATYYWEPVAGDWVIMRQETVTTADLHIQVDTGKGGPGTNALATPQTAAFDNFSVRQGRDTDADGLFDHEDNCPFASNADQVDSNGNGVGNACEWPGYIDLAQVRFQVTPLAEVLINGNLVMGNVSTSSGQAVVKPLAYPYALFVENRDPFLDRGFVWDLSQTVPDPRAGTLQIPSTSLAYPVIRSVAFPADVWNRSYRAINKHGAIVGGGSHYSSNIARHGMWLPDGAFQMFQVIGGSFFQPGVGNSISDTGWITGTHRLDSAIRWLPGALQAHVLPSPLSAGTEGLEVNDFGQCVGSFRIGSDLKPARWRSDGSYELLSVPAGLTPAIGEGSDVRSINNRNMCAGFVRINLGGSSRSYRPVRWDPDGTPRALPMLPSQLSAIVSDMDEYGSVIANSHTGTNPCTIWDNHPTSPKAYHLDSLIAPGGWGANTSALIVHVHEIETDASMIRILATVRYFSSQVFDRNVLLTAANPFQPNQLPTVTSPAAVSIDCTPPSGTAVTLATHVEDPDGDALTVQWLVNGTVVHTENVPSGGSTTAADLMLSHTFPPGMHSVVVVVDDGGPGPVQSSGSTVTITADSEKPSFSCPEIPMVEVGENCLAAVPDIASTVVASDDCSPAGEITITQSPTAGTLVGPGEHQLVLIATDGAGNTTTCGGRTITVFDATPPMIVDFPQQVIVTAEADCSATVPDLTGAVVASDNCSPNVQMSQDPPVGTIVLGAAAHTVTITVTDANGNPAPVIIELLVVDATPPVIVLDGAEVLTLECGEGVYEDPGAIAVDDCSGTSPVVVGGDQVDLATAGIYLVSYDAVDSAGNAAERVTRMVIVEPQTPTADAGEDQSVPEGAPVALDASGTTGLFCGSPTYEWTQIGGTPVTLIGADTATAGFTAPQVPMGGETLTFQLIVSNGPSIGEPDIVNVHVLNVNNAPVALADDLCDDNAVAEAGVATLDGSNSYDVDDEPLSYSWVQTGGTPVALNDADSAVATFATPLVGPAGEFLTFELTVSDGEDVSTVSIDVCIVNVNHAPIASAGADQTVAEGSVVTLDANGSSDQDGDTLTYEWTQVSGPAVVLGDDDTATPSFTAPQVGPAGATLVFRVTVDDGYGGSDSAEVTITVQDTAGAPECDLAKPSKSELWPPNHKLVPITITAVTHGSNPAVSITILSVTQDEPINGTGDGDTAPDAVIQGGTVLLRAERAGGGNGRVYRITFQATDGQGGTCTGSVTVRVPHDKGKNTPPAIDDGQVYNSLEP